VLYSDNEALRYLNSLKRHLARHNKWVEFLQDYTFVLKNKAGVENKVADALSWRVMILIVMSAEVTGFERLREEYESCPDFEKIYVTLWDDSIREMDNFLLQDDCSSGSINYVFPVRPLGIFSLGKYMLKVWLDISARRRRLRLLNTDSSG